MNDSESVAHLVKPLITTFLIPSLLAYSTYASQTAMSEVNFAVARFKMYIALRGREYVDADGGGGFR